VEGAPFELRFPDLVGNGQAMINYCVDRLRCYIRLTKILEFDFNEKSGRFDLASDYAAKGDDAEGCFKSAIPDLFMLKIHLDQACENVGVESRPSDLSGAASPRVVPGCSGVNSKAL